MHLRRTLPPYWQLQTPEDVEESHLVARYRAAMDAYLRDRCLIPAGRLHEISYEDLVQEPIQTASTKWLHPLFRPLRNCIFSGITLVYAGPRLLLTKLAILGLLVMLVLMPLGENGKLIIKGSSSEELPERRHTHNWDAVACDRHGKTGGSNPTAAESGSDSAL